MKLTQKNISKTYKLQNYKKHCKQSILVEFTILPFM